MSSTSESPAHAPVPDIERLRATVSSLEAQLIALYEEKEQSERAGSFHPTTDALEAAVASLSEQLREFYEAGERA